MADGRLKAYLGSGVLADQPAIPDIYPGTLTIYRATDSKDVSVWDEGADEWVSLVPVPEPFPDLSGFVTEAPNDQFLYARGGKQWVVIPAYPDVPVQEAPEDGNQYVRKDGVWEAFELPPIPEAGIPEAPDDGKLYGRKGEAWAEVVIPVPEPGGIEEAPTDGKQYARKNAAWAEVVGGGGGGGTPGPATLAGGLVTMNPNTFAFDLSKTKGVASVTRISAGQWRVNFAVPMANANYGVIVQPHWGGVDGNISQVIGSIDRSRPNAGKDVNGFDVLVTTAASETRYDPIDITFIVFDGAKGIGGGSGGGAGGGGPNAFGVIPLVMPDFTTFTEYKSNATIQTLLTVAEGRSHIAYTKTDNNWADDDGMAMMRPAPSTPTWEVVACVSIPMIEQTYVFCGIAGKRGGDAARLYGNAYFNDRFLTASLYSCVMRNGGGWTNVGDTSKPATQETRRWWRLQKTADSFVYSESRDGLIWETLWSNGIGDTGDWTEVGLGICTRLGGSYPPRNPRVLAWNVHHFSVKEGLSPF